MADVVVELSGNEKKLLDSYRRLVDAEAKQLAGLDNVVKKSKQVETETVKAFKHQEDGIDKVVGSVKALALQYVSLNAIVSLATLAFQKQNEEQQAATAQADKLFESRRNLSQVSNINDSDQLAKRLSRQFGLGAEEARDMLSQANSAGVGKDVGLLEMVAQGKSVLNATAGIDAGASMPGLFRKHNLTAADSLDYITVGADNSRVMMAKFVESLAKTMEQGGRIGVTPSEATATLAVLSGPLRDAAPARIGALYGQIAQDSELRDLPLFEAIKRIRSDETKRDELIGGNNEAAAAYEKIIESFDRLVTLSKDMERQVAGTPFLDKALAATTGEVGGIQKAYIRTQKAKAGAEALVDAESIDAQNWETARTEYLTVRKRQGAGPLQRYAEDVAISANRGLGFSPETFLENQISVMDKAGLSQGAKDLRDVLRDLRDILETSGRGHSAEQRARSQTQKDPG